MLSETGLADIRFSRPDWKAVPPPAITPRDMTAEQLRTCIRLCGKHLNNEMNSDGPNLNYVNSWRKELQVFRRELAGRA